MSRPVERVRALKGSVRGHMVFALAALVACVGGAGTLAATTPLSGAVILPGIVVVQSGVSMVQHATGGTVRAVLVEPGEVVSEGQLLMSLDATQLETRRSILQSTIAKLRLRSERLASEAQGFDTLQLSAPIVSGTAGEIAGLIDAEQRTFEARLAIRAGKRAQLSERIRQLEHQIFGLQTAITAKETEIAWSDKSLASLRSGYEQSLVQLSRLSDTEMAAARLHSELGQMRAQVAEQRGRIAEINLQIVEIGEASQADAALELQEVEAQLAELTEQDRALRDELAKLEIRAPVAGQINTMDIRTIGRVVAPGEQIMSIVPLQSALTVEARVLPQQIDQVEVGLTSHMRFSAFDQRTTPELKGEVTFVSPDLTPEPVSGQQSYVVRVKPHPAEMAKLGTVNLRPGMPVETFVVTQERTLLSYLARPLLDQLTRIFRD